MNLDMKNAKLIKGNQDWRGILHIISDNDDEVFEYTFVSRPVHGVSRVVCGYDFSSVDDCLMDAFNEGVSLEK